MKSALGFGAQGQRSNVSFSGLGCMGMEGGKSQVYIFAHWSGIGGTGRGRARALHTLLPDPSPFPQDSVHGSALE